MEHFLFEILLARKARLALALLVGILLAITLYFILPKKYTVTNGIRIGMYGGELLEFPEFTQVRLKQANFLADAFEKAGLNLDMPHDRFPSLVTASIENEFRKISKIDTLIFSTSFYDPEIAMKMNNAVTRHLAEVHAARLEKATSLRAKEIQVWEDRKAAIKAEIDKLTAMIDENVKTGQLKDIYLFMTLSKVEELRNILITLEREILTTRFENQNPTKVYNTDVVGPARVPETQTFPNMVVLLAVMLVLATMFWFGTCWLEWMFSSAPKNKSAEA